jgi:putative flippase GtrA
MITAFILNKLFVFEKSTHSTQKEFFYFTLVNVVAAIQTYIISIGLAQYVFPAIGFSFYPEAVAHAVGVIFPVFTSFIGHKYFSFRSSSL